MLRQLRNHFSALILLVLCSCASLTSVKKGLDTTMTALDLAVPTALIVSKAACKDDQECKDTAAKAHAGAEDALALIKQWLPELEKALEEGDEIKARSAREHLAAAIDLIPDAYEDVKALVLKISKR